MVWRYVLVAWLFSVLFVAEPVKAEETVLVRVVTTKDMHYYQDFFDGLVMPFGFPCSV